MAGTRALSGNHIHLFDPFRFLGSCCHGRCAVRDCNGWFDCPCSVCCSCGRWNGQPQSASCRCYSSGFDGAFWRQRCNTVTARRKCGVDAAGADVSGLSRRQLVGLLVSGCRARRRRLYRATNLLGKKRKARIACDSLVQHRALWSAPLALDHRRPMFTCSLQRNDTQP